MLCPTNAATARQFRAIKAAALHVAHDVVNGHRANARAMEPVPPTSRYEPVRFATSLCRVIAASGGGKPS
jgi:hypothetical protein